MGHEHGKEKGTKLPERLVGFSLNVILSVALWYIRTLTSINMGWAEGCSGTYHEEIYTMLNVVLRGRLARNR